MLPCFLVFRCGSRFRFCRTCRSVNRIAVFKALAFRKEEGRTLRAWQAVWGAGASAGRASQSRPGGTRQGEGVSSYGVRVFVKKGSISPKTGSGQTTNQFSFVLYAS